MNQNEPTKGRILVVSQLPPPIHGSTIMTQRFIYALSKNGYIVDIVQRPFSRKQKDVAKITLTKILKIPIFCCGLVKNVLFNRPKLVIFFVTVGFGSFMIDCLLLFILRMFRVEYVLYMHGIGLNKWGRSSNYLIHLISKKSLTAALGGIVLGDNLKFDVLDYISDEHLIILPNGIPDDACEYLNKNIHDIMPSKLKKKNPLIVLFLANLLPNKGPMIFLDMAKKLLQSDIEILFVMAGGARDLAFNEIIEQYIKNEGLDNFISRPGEVYNDAKNILFQNADIFVFPSRREAFPLVNLEAMQWGLPVISTSVGAIPEAVIDGSNGYIVEIDDVEALCTRVIKLAQNPQLLIDMSNKSRERFENEYSLTAYNKKVGKTIQFFINLQQQKSNLASKEIPSQN